MGIRFNTGSLEKQLERTGQFAFMKYRYKQAIARNEVPLSIGGGTGRSRTFTAVLKKAHLVEASVMLWLKVLKETCAKRNIHVLELASLSSRGEGRHSPATSRGRRIGSSPG